MSLVALRRKGFKVDLKTLLYCSKKRTTVFDRATPAATGGIPEEKAKEDKREWLKIVM